MAVDRHVMFSPEEKSLSRVFATLHWIPNEFQCGFSERPTYFDTNKNVQLCVCLYSRIHMEGGLLSYE